MIKFTPASKYATFKVLSSIGYHLFTLSINRGIKASVSCGPLGKFISRKAVGTGTGYNFAEVIEGTWKHNDE